MSRFCQTAYPRITRNIRSKRAIMVRLPWTSKMSPTPASSSRAGRPTATRGNRVSGIKSYWAMAWAKARGSSSLINPA